MRKIIETKFRATDVRIFSDSSFFIYIRRFAGCLYHICRGEVFANAQTGNIVLLSQSLVERKWSTVIHYLIPLGFFAMGIRSWQKVSGKNKKKYRGFTGDSWFY